MYSVVFIDDEPWSAAFLKDCIDWKKFGFYISEIYNNPVLALREICNQSPDLVIVDITMPILDGLSLIKKAQDDGCGSEFIILSAHREFDFAQTAIKLDVLDFCLKPINPNDFSVLLSSVKSKLDEVNELSADSTANENNFDDIVNFINDNLNKKITLQNISDEFFLNRTYICSLFKKNLNTTFSLYLTEIRLEKAKFLLTHTNLKHTEIAIKTGFKDEFYFNKVFKKATNMSPGVYKKLYIDK